MECEKKSSAILTRSELSACCSCRFALGEDPEGVQNWYRHYREHNRTQQKNLVSCRNGTKTYRVPKRRFATILTALDTHTHTHTHTHKCVYVYIHTYIRNHQDAAKLRVY
jgi:hypothetical protein